MTDHDDSVRADTTPATRDPSLQLFGHGWTPDPEPTPDSDSDSYEGRHRAPDA